MLDRGVQVWGAGSGGGGGRREEGGELSVCLSLCVCVSVSVYVSVCMSDMGDKYCNVFSFPRELYRELTGPALPKD